jgi:DNA-binding IclR family transcriptional regulator
MRDVFCITWIEVPSVMVDDHTVVGRAVAILDVVADAGEPVPLAVLTRRTGIPKPTVRRITRDLVARGMLERTAEGYVVGIRLLRQGLRALFHNGDALAAQPYLQDLHLHSRGELAWFAAVHAGELTAAGAAFGRVHLPAMRTTWWPATSRLGPSAVLLAAGRLQISYQPEQADRILLSGWAPLTRYSVTDRGRLRALLTKARETGFAHEDEQAMLGWSCMAAVVHDRSGAMIGAIGVSGRSSGVSARGLRGGLLSSARSLEHDLRVSERRNGEPAWNTPTFNRRSGIGYVWPTHRVIQ